MVIETIIQSTNYADFLAITLAENVKVLDDITVYTKAGDEATKKVCADHGVRCIETTNFTKGGASFNRGAVYNESFKNLRYNDWVLVLDSDIVLPADFREQIAAAGLRPHCFYGARRFNIETMDDWLKVKADPSALKDYLLYRGYGYGYFQLFHSQSFTFRALLPDAYPEWCDGSEADWRFRNKWGDVIWKPDFDKGLGHNEPNPEDPGTHYLRCLPFHVVHLGITGVNATGRHTPSFT